MDYPDASEFILTYKTIPNGIRYQQDEMYDKEMAERLERFLVDAEAFQLDKEMEAVHWLIGEHRQLCEMLESLHGDEGLLEKHKLEIETKDDKITDLEDGLEAIKKIVESYKESRHKRKDGAVLIEADDVELIIEHCTLRRIED